jgi:hypothetical protein
MQSIENNEGYYYASQGKGQNGSQEVKTSNWLVVVISKTRQVSSHLQKQW